MKDGVNVKRARTLNVIDWDPQCQTANRSRLTTGTLVMQDFYLVWACHC